MFARRLLRDTGSQFIGDLLSVRATAAYSLRRLYSSYTGNALTLRRSQDNAVADIGFTAAGELDTTALLNHVGYQNLLTHSEQFDNAAWQKTSTIVAPNSATAPDGTLTADRVTGTSVAPFTLLIHQTITHTVNIGDTYTASAWVRNASPDLSFRLVRVGGSYEDASILVPQSSDWQRISVTRTFTNPQTGLRIDFINNTVSNPSIEIWGAQINQGSTPQPYQQTVATAWTSLNGFVATWYDQSINGYNATQPTAGNQPQIVVNGVLQTQNSRPTLVGNGNQWLVAGTSTDWTRTTVDGANNVVAFRTSGTNLTAIIGASALASTFGYLEVGSQLGGFRVNTRSTPSLDTFAVGSVTSLAIVTATASSTSLNLHINGVNQSSLTSSAMIPSAPTSGLVIFNRGTNPDTTTFVGAISEVTIFKDMILSATDRQTLERNQGAYYRIQVI